MVVANSNIFASNVVPSTQPVNAPPLINSVPLSPRMAQVLHSRPVTPVKVDRLEYLLHGYPASLQEYLVSGFSCGFHIHFMGERHAFESPNLKSALEQPQIVVSKLNKERDAGRIVGPFSEPPFHNFRCSPLGIVPKKDPSEFRLIHHLSYPPGSSVNDFIPEDCSSVHYASINDTISVIKRKGAGCFMAKTDVKSAFRIIPIHPNDFALLGMKWQNSYYFDRCLPMGCSSSCAIFEAFSTALEWLAINRLGASGVHILDDFLFIADSEDKCHADLTNFLGMCEYLGVPIAHEKTVGPDTTLQFAGITLDSVMQEARLPVDKLQKCRMLLRTFYKRRKVTLRELQSLLGLLNFTCSVIVPGRAFLRRMIDLTKGAQRPYHRTRLSKEAKSDMVTWLTFLDKFNGKTFFLDDRWDTSSSLDLFTDAAGSKGYGAIFGKHWFCGAWPASWTSLNIAFLELFPIVLSLHIWGPLMANKCVAFYTDNAAIVDIINQQTSKHPLVMILVRDLVLTSLTYNILFRARHIPGVHNTGADYISRFQVEQFKKISPGADELPTPVPTHLLPENWSLR